MAQPPPQRDRWTWPLVAARSPLVAAGGLVGATTALSWLLVVDAWSRPSALAVTVVGGMLVAGLAAVVRSPYPVGRPDVAAVAVLWVGVATWVVVNVPYVSEYLFVGRDPAVYTLTGLWLLDGPGAVIPLGAGGGPSSGFQEGDGVVYAQGNHAAPAVAALVGMVVGPAGVLGANLLVGAGVLLALYAVGRPLVGPWWALLPVSALAVSLPFLYTTRGLYSEPLGSATVLAGLAAGLHAWRTGAWQAWLLLGLGIGASATTRIDASSVLIGVLPVLALRGLQLHTGGRRWRILALVGAGSAPGLVAGRLDLELNSPGYLADLAADANLLLAGVGVGAVVAVVVLVLPLAARSRTATLLATPGSAGALAGGLLLVFVVLVSRPLWYTDRSGDSQPYVTGLQTQAGEPGDPTQRYAELSMTWLSWYHGWPAVALGAVGLCGILWSSLRRPREGASLLLVAVVLPALLLYLVRPGIFPDQIWAMRRYVVLAAPGLLVAATVLLQRAWREGEAPARTVAGATAVAILLAPVGVLPGVARVTEGGGSVAAAGALCAAVDGRPAVVTGRSGVAATLRLLCGVEVQVLPDAGSEDPVPAGALLAADRALGGDSVLVTADPGTVWSADAVPAPAVAMETTRWERTLLHAPRVGVREPTRIWAVPVDELVG